MAKIVEAHREIWKPLRLIGRSYGEGDRNEEGLFSHHWAEWMRNGWFAQLEQLGPAEPSCMGGIAMGVKPYRYWIGMLFPAQSPVPDGWEFADLNQADMAVLWIQAPANSPDLYLHGDAADRELQRHGWVVDDCGWFFERYHSTRFTQPDENGEVILDYCIAVKAQ